MDASNSKKCVAIGISSLETVITLPWIPPTTAAVALRLMEFDAAISYRLHQEVESSVEEGSGYSLKLSSGVKDLSGAGTLGTPYQAGCLKEDDCVELDAIFTTCGRARRIHQGLGPTCGRQQRASGFRNKCGKQSIVANKGLNQIHKWKRQPQGRGCRGGRQSIRNRQKLLKNMGKVGKVKNTSEQNIFENSLERIRNDDEDVALPIQHAARNSDRSYYDDENYQASGHEYEEVVMTDDTVGF